MSDSDTLREAAESLSALRREFHIVAAKLEGLVNDVNRTEDVLWRLAVKLDQDELRRIAREESA